MELKDYLHLYLGCRGQLLVQYHHGLAEQIVDSELHAVFNGHDSFCFNCFDIEGNQWEHTMHLPAVKFKPIIRPLSDMTEEERTEFEKTKMFIRATPVHHVGNMQWTPETFRWCLSKDFDLFGLIEAGLAIDKTTINK